MITVQGVIFGELLRQHGIASVAELGRRLDIARQHAWLLWTGRHLPSYEILQRLAADVPCRLRLHPPRAGYPLSRSMLITSSNCSGTHARRRSGAGRHPRRSYDHSQL
jgi:transcriptional regulator with XRE-family HTH domain